MGLDAESSPSAAAMLAAGFTFMARYLAPLPNPKVLTPFEAARLSAGGVLLVSVFESTAGRALEGALAGAADVAVAVGQARACGQPEGRPIYFAVDVAADPQRVLAYFQDVAMGSWPYTVGVYGDDRVVDTVMEAGFALWGWQTAAWSAGRITPRAHVYQQATVVTVGGVRCDVDLAVADDFGGWTLTGDQTLEEIPMTLFRTDEAAARYLVRKTYFDVLHRELESAEIQTRWVTAIVSSGEPDTFLAAVMDSAEGRGDMAHLAALEAWELRLAAAETAAKTA